MNHDWGRPPHGPTPEQLADYFDGELTGAAHAAVEAWLADHPDATTEGPFAGRDDALVRAWQAASPPDPSAAIWAGVLARIEADVHRPVRLPARRRPVALFLGFIAAAAAIVAAIVVGRALWPAPSGPDEIGTRPHPPRVASDEEIFAVVSPADVRIISMDGCDTCVDLFGVPVPSLVVGELPLGDDELLFPTSYEKTRLVGWVDPELRFDDWNVPMIIDPQVLAKGWEP